MQFLMVVEFKGVFNSDEMHEYIVRFFAGYGYERMEQLKVATKNSFRETKPVLKFEGVKAENIKDISFSINQVKMFCYWTGVIQL